MEDREWRGGALVVSGEGSSQSSVPMDVDPCGGDNGEDILPDALWGEIFSHFTDARDLSRAALVNSFFRNQCRYAKNVRFNCELRNLPRKAPNGEASRVVTPFKEAVMSSIKNYACVETLRLEIEEDIQARRFKQDELDRSSLWLSEGSFVRSWLPPVCASLTNLTLVDYGHQAIFHPSPLLPLLSQHCPRLQKLEVRNMFLDTKSCQKMTHLTHLKMKFVKLMENGLQDLGVVMPALQLLVVESVVGLREARLKADDVRVMCLTCITRVSSVRLDCPALQALQLKVHSPEEVRVKAPALQTLTLRMTKRPSTVVEFEGVKALQQLLMGATEMTLLQTLARQNRHLRKVFLDVPCLDCDDKGTWKGPLRDNMPPYSDIWGSLACCSLGLSSLSAGPGFWLCLEEAIKGMIEVGDENSRQLDRHRPYAELVRAAVEAQLRRRWCVMERLIVHLVVQEAELSFGLLAALIRAMPALQILEVYVHKDSAIPLEEFCHRLWEVFPGLHITCESWSKHLKFDCFTVLTKLV